MKTTVGSSTDEWVLLDYRPVSMAQRLGLAASSLHDERGRHLATSAQEIFCRVAAPEESVRRAGRRIAGGTRIARA